MTANGHKVSFQSVGLVLKSIVVMVVQLYQYNKIPIELYTLSGGIVWHINYFSIILVKIIYNRLYTTVFLLTWKLNLKIVDNSPFFFRKHY